MDDMPKILGDLIEEIKGLKPRFESLIEEADARMVALSAQNLTGEAYARTQLPVAIALEAAKKTIIFLENNLVFLETVGVLGLTRYVFELHIWLKVIESNRLRSVEFFQQVHEDQEKHISRYIQRLNAEANSFDELSKEDGLPESLLAMAQSNAEKLTAEFVHAEIAKKAAAVDLRARRSFALYRRAATTNGYTFQAHLIRSRAVKAAQDQLDQVRASKMEFETQVTKSILAAETIGVDGKRKRWNWRAEADRVGMVGTYDFIYAYTSRLLHATPTSFYTIKKNLEMEEMETFLEFTYVTLLDLNDVAGKLVRS